MDPGLPDASRNGEAIRGKSPDYPRFSTGT